VQAIELEYRIAVKKVPVNDEIFKVHLAENLQYFLRAANARPQMQIAYDKSVVFAHECRYCGMLIWRGQSRSGLLSDGTPLIF
jgi:hypothetical protein